MELNQAHHAFITGGASGLGLGIADALVERGLKVTLADIDRLELTEVLPQRSDAYRGQHLDVRDRADWAKARAEAEDTFGPVDILVNNAGIAPIGHDIADEDPATFDTVIAINLTGVFNGVATFARDMRARGRGHIVNTGSMAGLMINAPGFGTYAVAKFGVVAMSEQLRLEMAQHGIGVSVLCPGYVPTNISRNTVRVAGDITNPPMVLPPADLSARGGRRHSGGRDRARPSLYHHPSRQLAHRREPQRGPARRVRAGRGQIEQ